MSLIPVLLYHSVSRQAAPALADYTITPELFADHVAVIVGQGWRVVTITELNSRIRAGLDVHRTLAITFDDGFADNAEEAAEILATYALPATLYVTSGTVEAQCSWLGEESRRPMVSWNQLRDLESDGWEIGAHSVTHPELDVLSGPQASWEITHSRSSLQDGLGFDIASFAYPHGYHSPRVRDEVVRAGYDSACAVKDRFSDRADDPFARARLTVPSALTGDALASLLHVNETDPRVTFERRCATQAWRTYRKARILMRRATR